MRYRRLSTTLTLAGSALFGVLELGQTVFRSDQPLAGPMSNYAVGRYGFLQTIAFVALSVASLALCAGLSCFEHPPPAWSAGRLLLGTWSVGVLLAAVFPVDAGARSASGQVHGVASAVSFVAVLAAMFVLGATFAETPAWAPFSRLTGRLARFAAAAFLVAGATSGTFAFGIVHRAFVATVVAWLMIAALRLRSMLRPHSSPVPREGLSDADKVRSALVAIKRGDLGPLSALLDVSARWNPVAGRVAGPCLGREEILANMQRHLDGGFRLEGWKFSSPGTMSWWGSGLRITRISPAGLGSGTCSVSRAGW